MSREVTAAVVREKGSFVLETVHLEDPRDDEILVKIEAAGLCHTDLVVRDQVYPVPLPVVLGHEGSGIVEELGDGVEGLAPGDHVVCSWIPYCGACRRCASGRPALCERLVTRGAGFLADGDVVRVVAPAPATAPVSTETGD